MIEETLIYINYAVYEERHSEIDKGRIIAEEIGLKCPQCGTFLSFIPHGQAQTCGECSLEMTRYGNALHCKKYEEIDKEEK